MAINGNFTQSPQKQNSTKQGKQKKDLASFVGKSKTGETLPEQHTDSQEIRQLQNKLMKSRALNNVSFQGYSKSITKSQSGSHYGSGGSSVSAYLGKNDVSKEIGDGYDVTGEDISKSVSFSNSSGTATANGTIYVADPGEHITQEIREKYNFIAEPSVRDAVKEGNLEKVKALLNTGIKVDTKDQGGLTPLHTAIRENNLNMVKLLLEKGADANTKVKRDFYSVTTPLYHATEQNNIEITKVLLQHGADINEKSSRTLHNAADNNNLDMAKLLIEKGADINSHIDNYGVTPLYHATEQNNLEMIKLLLEKGANINPTQGEYVPLHIAADKNDLEMAKFLIDKGADVNPKSEYCAPLNNAADNNNLDMVKFLVDKGADVNPNNNINRRTPLMSAADNNNLDMVKFLIDKGANVNKNVEPLLQPSKMFTTPLHYALLHENKDMVRILAEKGADVNIEIKSEKKGIISPLAYFTWQNNSDISKILLANGADVNFKTKDGETPLHFAAENQDLAMVKSLIEKGADINAKTKDGTTPLHEVLGYDKFEGAKSYDKVEIVKLFVKKGADINAKTDVGTMPLHQATDKNSLEIAKFLIEQGADINAKATYKLKTPLHYAAECNNLDLVKFLVLYGADINAKADHIGGGSICHTPWDYAPLGSQVKDYLKDYTIQAVQKGKSYSEIYKEQMDSKGDGITGDLKRIFSGQKDIDKAMATETSETVIYQNRVLEVNNRLQELQRTALKNLTELRKDRSSEKEIDEATNLAAYYKRITDLTNINGFGKMAGYDDIKNVLKDHVCTPIALEKEGNLSATDRVPAGILFYGPMGTGKTTFAVALAGQTECKYVPIKHKDTPLDTFKKIEEEAANAQKRFKEEGKRTILHLDEIDALADERKMADRLKQFMDTSSEEYHCTLVTTTNHPDQIDEALLRRGRFIKVALPPANKKNAAAIIQHYAEAAGTTGEIKYEEIAEHIVKHQPERAFSNDVIKETVISVGQKATQLGKKIAHTDLIEAFKAERPDISKTALELFEKNKQLLK